MVPDYVESSETLDALIRRVRELELEVGELGHTSISINVFVICVVYQSRYSARVFLQSD